jgi:hypothetical protein
VSRWRRAGGLSPEVVVQEQGVTSNNSKFGIYATTNRGWTGVVDALTLVAKTKNKPKSKRRSSR